ncbi:hypothetical protein HHK36_026088 [Tetracentron sinense]|uniref:RING-type E3 ubiquitin transferase n=1 Tax=Tetracentron sinense TaxID=13715 RepID=A0A834YMT2_TETSI|nr:hypothetical protein HHK36_026088 [Tetracentron sinense]
MDEYSGKRAAGGLSLAKRGSGRSFRDTSNNEDRSIQCCNRIGCSTRFNSMNDTQIGSSDRAKYSRTSFHSASGKAIVGSSSKTYSAVREPRKSQQKPHKPSSFKEAVPAATSSMQQEMEVSEVIPSTERIQTGLSELEDSKSGVLEGFSADTSGEVASYSIASKTNSRKQIHQRSGSGSSDTSLGSSVQRSFASRNTSQVAKPAYPCQGPNSSRNGLRNLGCTSMSDVLQSDCSSSDSSRSRRNDVVKKRSPDGGSSSARGKNMSESLSGGNSVSQRNSLSSLSLSLSERPSSQQTARRGRNWPPSRDGVVSVRTRRTINGDTRTRISDHGNGNSLSMPEPQVAIPRLPQTEIPTSGTAPPSSSPQLLAEVPSVRLSSYTRPGSNSENVRSRPNRHPEDGIGRPFHGLSMDRDGFQRYNMDGIAEVLLALERIEQDEELTYEQLLVLETNLFLGGLGFHDQHRDMRLDIDNMSYEELLALGEKMGTVSTALTEEALSNCLERSCYMPAPPDAGSMGCGGDDVKCSICQEEYIAGDEMGKLDCEHRFHMVCIHQWLQQKNWCPICKASAAPS